MKKSEKEKEEKLPVSSVRFSRGDKKILEDLVAHYGENQTSVIRRALTYLHAVTFGKKPK